MGKMYIAARGKTKKKKRTKMVKRYMRKYAKFIPFVLRDKYICKLRYCDEITLNAGIAGVAVGNQYKANSLFDPNITGVGHQPMGFDQLSLVYKKFTVLASTIKCTWTNGDNASTQPSHFGISIVDQDDTVIGLTYPDIMEQEKHTKSLVVGLNNQYDPRNKGLSAYFVPRKYFGVKDMVQDEYTCTAAADAAQYAKYIVWQCAVGGGLSEPGLISVAVHITYLVLCRDPILLAQS